MAILTNKALEHFLNWKVNNKNLSTIEVLDFKHLSITSQNALIIEFFDSVGIYVNVLKYGLSEPNKWVIIKSLCENNLDFIYSSRQEATIQAIKKANDIYNTDKV